MAAACSFGFVVSPRWMRITRVVFDVMFNAWWVKSGVFVVQDAYIYIYLMILFGPSW